MNKCVRNNPNFFRIKGNNDAIELQNYFNYIFKILIFYTVTSIPLLIVLSIYYIHPKICIYAESQGAQQQQAATAAGAAAAAAVAASRSSKP